MSKIRVLSDQLANQIAAGEVVERPASVAKELVENAIDAKARRISVDIEAGGRRLLRVTDNGSGMTRDDALLAFERHATSKISRVEDLQRIATLGFRGEALASIASVARVELITSDDERAAATRLTIDGGRLRDVKDAAHPRGTTISVRDLFFNIPARRKFLRSEATENFHLTNLVTHYALAHPEIAFDLTNNGREVLRATPATDLRERAYQIFGASFLENLLEVNGGRDLIARVRGLVSAPLERRTSRDAQYLFVNGRFVRDRLISRALAEGYRSVLPPGTYPVALLFLDVPFEEVDVNVHPAKTEVRFRRAAAVVDAVRETVRQALASAGFAHAIASETENAPTTPSVIFENESPDVAFAPPERPINLNASSNERARDADAAILSRPAREEPASVLPQQNSIEFSSAQTNDILSDRILSSSRDEGSSSIVETDRNESSLSEIAPDSGNLRVGFDEGAATSSFVNAQNGAKNSSRVAQASDALLPPLVSIESFVRDVSPQTISGNIRPLGQLEDSFIIATDEEGLLLIDQHKAHERILFDKYLAREAERPAESQHLLVPETFDLTPAQASVFDALSSELELYGFSLMRLSGRTVAIKAVPFDLPVNEARNMLAEVLDTLSVAKRGSSRDVARERVAATLACRAAVKSNTPLAMEKMRWLIEHLLKSSSPTTCPHGRPLILRLATHDIVRGFHRT